MKLSVSSTASHVVRLAPPALGRVYRDARPTPVGEEFAAARNTKAIRDRQARRLEIGLDPAHVFVEPTPLFLVAARARKHEARS